MRKEYIEYYVGRYRLKAHDNAVVLKVLPELFAQAALDPQGLEKLAATLGIPAVRAGACVSCGVLADYALSGDEALWCEIDKPEGAVYVTTRAEENRRFRNAHL